MDATKNSIKVDEADEASVDERHERYLTEHTRCALCESPLELGHEIDSFRAVLVEEARCAQCGVRARAVRHRLH